MSRLRNTLLAVVAIVALLLVTIWDRPTSPADAVARYQTRQRTSQFFGRSTMTYARRS